jgi:hypothetical protein
MAMEELEREVLRLPESSRLELLNVILGSFTSDILPEIEAAWGIKSNHRLNAILRGEMRTYPADEVRRELRAGLLQK